VRPGELDDETDFVSGREYARPVPELRHLRYFVAVAEELNFSRAAERLHMARPPLSVAIRQLEQEIGASLFVRTTHEVRLTEAGTALLSGARRTLEEAQATVAAAQRAAAGELGSLRVGDNWSARFETLPALGRAFGRRYPDVELLAEEMRPNRMPEALQSGTIDVAVALYPELADGFTYRTIRREPVVALLSSTHPLAHEAHVELGALAEDACCSRASSRRACTTSPSTSAAARAWNPGTAASRRARA
jgi:DNA-binding transcriptional LysR family regulator